MQMETFERDDRLVCLLFGSFGFAAYEAFDEILARFSASNVCGLEIDLSGLTSVDSVALSMLRVAHDVATRMERGFEMIGASGDVARRLTLAEVTGPGAEHGASAIPVVVLIDDAPSDAFRADCAALGLTAAAIGDIAPEYRAIHFGAATPDAVRAALQPPGCGFFEAAEDGIAGVDPRCLEAVRLGGIALSVLTSTACSLELPELFEAAVRLRYPLGKRASDGLISLCLGEAVSNAVIHGNLGIASGMRATREGFALFRTTMNERLADPSRSSRRVEITLRPFGSASFSIAVTDHGDGFDWSRQALKTGNANDKQGRGLSLIRQAARLVSAEDGGRTITMAF
ncbi:MAG TPA: ATP-binding protein [Patescibacteria group bacterium]|nr:ATP-binding protein [Patescibacteria group bacterium]